VKGYTHKGIVGINGSVDVSQSITDPARLTVSPADDSFLLQDPECGDFEWWYFDIIDPVSGCILKLIAHLGTNPLRRRFFPQVAVSLRTPNRRQSFIRSYLLGDFHASRNVCDVGVKDEFHAVAGSSAGDDRYHISVDIQGFRAEADFISEIEGWKPLGNAVTIARGKKQGVFSWIIPVPKATVVGEFWLGRERYELNGALGYHDHNYWKAVGKKKLFMDDAISQWYWGRFLSKDYTAIFMDTHLKPHPIKSLMIAKRDNIIHSSNNLIEVFAEKLSKDGELQTFYPSTISVQSLDQETFFQMTLQSKELIDKRDLLEGVNPLLKRLIKAFISRPAYYGILADSAIKIADKPMRGTALYEYMSFRNKT